MVLLSLPYRQTVVTFNNNGAHYTWYETDEDMDPSIGGGIYVKTLPAHERSWWWCERLNRWRRVQWTLEDIARSSKGPGWDVQWSWAYADAYECNEEWYTGDDVYPMRIWYPESYSPAGRSRLPGRSTPY